MNEPGGQCAKWNKPDTEKTNKASCQFHVKAKQQKEVRCRGGGGRWGWQGNEVADMEDEQVFRSHVQQENHRQ
jgi:hypothetical protein